MAIEDSFDLKLLYDALEAARKECETSVPSAFSSSSKTRNPTRVAVIGSGVAGLAAAKLVLLPHPLCRELTDTRTDTY